MAQNNLATQFQPQAFPDSDTSMHSHSKQVVEISLEDSHFSQFEKYFF